MGDPRVGEDITRIELRAGKEGKLASEMKIWARDMRDGYNGYAHRLIAWRAALECLSGKAADVVEDKEPWVRTLERISERLEKGNSLARVDAGEVLQAVMIKEQEYLKTLGEKRNSFGTAQVENRFLAEYAAELAELCK